MTNVLLGWLLILVGLGLAGLALWQEEPPQGVRGHALQLCLPVGFILSQLGALLVAVPGFFGP